MPSTAETLRRLTARTALLVLTTLLGAAAGLLYAATRSPTYEASAYVILSPAAPSVADSTAVSLAQAYGRITTQDAVLARAGTLLGNGSADTLRRAVRVSTSPDAPLVRITGTATGPAAAAARANAVATALIGYGNQRSPRTRVRLDSFAEASPPSDPSAPRRSLDIAVGAAAGLLIGGLAAAAGGGRREPAAPVPAAAAHPAAGAVPATAGHPAGGRMFWAVPAEHVMDGIGDAGWLAGGPAGRTHDRGTDGTSTHGTSTDGGNVDGGSTHDRGTDGTSTHGTSTHGGNVDGGSTHDRGTDGTSTGGGNVDGGRPVGGRPDGGNALGGRPDDGRDGVPADRVAGPGHGPAAPDAADLAAQDTVPVPVAEAGSRRGPGRR
jgi:capsular polysaccharide biosynthesis protein